MNKIIPVETHTSQQKPQQLAVQYNYSHLNADLRHPEWKSQSEFIDAVRRYPASGKRLINQLFQEHRSKDVVFASQATIARKIGVRRQRTNELVSELKSKGVIYVTSRGHRQTNNYYVSEMFAQPIIRRALSKDIPALRYVSDAVFTRYQESQEKADAYHSEKLRKKYRDSVQFQIKKRDWLLRGRIAFCKDNGYRLRDHGVGATRAYFEEKATPLRRIEYNLYKPMDYKDFEEEAYDDNSIGSDRLNINSDRNTAARTYVEPRSMKAPVVSNTATDKPVYRPVLDKLAPLWFKTLYNECLSKGLSHPYQSAKDMLRLKCVESGAKFPASLPTELELNPDFDKPKAIVTQKVTSQVPYIQKMIEVSGADAAIKFCKETNQMHNLQMPDGYQVAEQVKQEQAMPITDIANKNVRSSNKMIQKAIDFHGAQAVIEMCRNNNIMHELEFYE